MGKLYIIGVSSMNALRHGLMPLIEVVRSDGMTVCGAVAYVAGVDAADARSNAATK